MKERDIRNKAVELFKNSGHITWFAPKIKWHSTDIFGIFDLVVVSRNTHETWFVQLTDITNLAHRRKKIIDYFVEHNVVIPNSFIFAWDHKKNDFKKVRVDISELIHATPAIPKIENGDIERDPRS